jgi:hypothetical protein
MPRATIVELEMIVASTIASLARWRLILAVVITLPTR